MKMAMGVVSARVRNLASLSRSDSEARVRSMAVATCCETKVSSSRSASVKRCPSL
jgi:hypothetical protein